MIYLLRQKRNKKGFTLIELVVVIAILGILMSIAIPKASAFRDNAAVKADQATAATIGQAIELYILGGDEIKEIDTDQKDDILKVLNGAKLIDDEECKPQYKNVQFEIIYNKEGVKINYKGGQVKIGNKIYKELYPKTKPTDNTEDTKKND